ncbi:hypothetical protein VB834_23810 [Limnoraphis robusta Tam1]|jgi:hypothetical protein|uniref:hypothetical protein n=1 Tax=Limnoraphis robusta TaxID=1118279 RepID=UPI002B1FF930|nr:hypothetical protein [Limnoraphis robusta]MEA5497430.1 hypothetical protein [Limnoraphis robusta BA-68 BA1]MEA5542063.1 hypothetical protein [Limnoraphis robusta Tam1]
MADTHKKTGGDEGHYDRNIQPAEVGARQDREGDQYKKLPEKEGGIDTTKGYTVDQEGLMNNYAIEPEMYVNTPGDLREEEEAEKQERVEELKEVQKHGQKGQGVI